MSDVVTALSFLTANPENSNPLPFEPSPSNDHHTEEQDGKETAEAERQRAVAEAMEWGSKSKSWITNAKIFLEWDVVAFSQDVYPCFAYLPMA